MYLHEQSGERVLRKMVRCFVKLRSSSCELLELHIDDAIQSSEAEVQASFERVQRTAVLWLRCAVHGVRIGRGIARLLPLLNHGYLPAILQAVLKVLVLDRAAFGDTVGHVIAVQMLPMYLP